ncbi:amino acid adenylation domain-containing protein [Krasilnikovia sp. MM14-A1004]|uniref:amino acid adenylation domain-containing protein n=1 Tax=Krasilnikovia sp. MM14-A1004 TaxID=3373541 RepID=UPI00399D386A
MAAFDAVDRHLHDSDPPSERHGAGGAPADPASHLSVQDRQRLLHEWNGTAVALPDLTVPQVFDLQVARDPDAIAVESQDGTLTYAELGRRAARLAARLAGHGVPAGGAVAVRMRRSADLVVALLAIARAGYAFVPLDARYPAPVVRTMLQRSGCSLVVADRSTGQQAREYGLPLVLAGSPDDDGAADFADATPGPDATFYVMHTSGSTGEPKGVEVTHRNVIALALDRIWRGGAHERVLFHSPHAFDASTYELWVPLLIGGRVVVSAEDVTAPLLRRLIGAGRITALWLTAGLFSALADGDPGCLNGIREVWTGGDVVSRRAVDRIAAACAGITIVNGYGPTEATTFATRYRIHPGTRADHDIPIGEPMDNTRVYVLDEHGRLLPPYEAGQLYIGGPGVARGYRGRPDLTGMRFVPDPFGAPGDRLYATGDLVRWDEQGQLHYLGRIDDQVKIHGFRIEPAEIEAALAAHPRVAQAAVAVDKDSDGGGRIRAWVVPVDGHADDAELRRDLADRLPSFMIPEEIGFLAALPLTPNGKVDRRRLGRAGGVPDLVHHWVRRQPEAIAVHDPMTGHFLTYDELWRLAGRLAAALREAGVRRTDRVAVALDRSVNSVVAYLAVARAGAAYLPLDPQAPRDRVADITTDAAVTAAIVAEGAGRRGISPSVPVLTVEAQQGEGDLPDIAGAGGEDPLYVTYTSGSTGRPKGVVIPHRAVVSLVTGAEYCPISAGDRVANTCNPAFDVTTCEVWSTLASGGTVVPFPLVSDMNMDEWVALLRDERIITMFLTTSLFHTVARERPAAFGTLRNLVVGGEQLELPATLRVLAEGPPGRLINGYGPTEATAFATWFHCTPESLAGRDRIPIGYPLQETTLYVLDDALAPVPAGESGELCIGGPGVADGYLNRPELTGQRFVSEPRTGERIYRTGDLVRVVAGDALEMLGRRDRQVKLRGFRIELEEIERAAVATGLVEAAFVDKDGDGDAAELVGAVLPSPRPEVSTDELAAVLSARLAERLPGYMVPARWMPLSRLPIGPTGKADRAAISRSLRAHRSAAADARPEPPGGLATPTERHLAQLWTDLLGVPVTSRDASFWDLGGHSLRLFTLATRIRDQLGVQLKLRELFRHPRLSDLAALIDRSADGPPPATAAPQPREVPAADFQQRIWAAQKLEGSTGLYNVPFAWRLSGRLDADRLAGALAKVIERHEALRTTFAERDGALHQVVRAPWTPIVERRRCADDAALEGLLEAEGAQVFDLESGPLLRMSVIETGSGQVLTFTVHHLIFDIGSLSLVLDELSRYYAGDEVAGTPVRQFRELLAVTELADPAILDRTVKRLRGAPSRLPIHVPEHPEVPGAVPLPIPADMLHRIRRLQDERGMSWFMVCAAALGGVLHRWTGSDELTFGFPTSTRTGDEFRTVVGPCLNTVVVRSTCTAATTVAQMLESARDGVLEALEESAVPFGAVVSALNPPRSADSTPYLDVVLAPQVQAATPPSLGGCLLTPLSMTRGTELVGKFAVTLGLTVVGDRLTGSLLYRGDRLGAAAAAELATQFVRTLEAFLTDPERTVRGLDTGLTRQAGPGAAPSAAERPETAQDGSPVEADGALTGRVAELWRTVLGRADIGLDDNFFDRGGNSLKLITLHADLCRQFRLDLPIQRLFEHCTVRSMARYLAGAGRSATDPSSDSDLDRRGAARRQYAQQRHVRR